MIFNSSILTRLSKTTGSLQYIGEYAALSYRRYPKFYTGLAVFAAITGYLFVLLFPLFILESMLQVYRGITSDSVDWQSVSIWLVVGAAAAFISYRVMQVKIVEPAGLTLSADSAPELFRLIQRVKESFGRPTIHRVAITGNYELDIRKSPRWFLPVWSSNVLVIGLPVMTCHTPEHLACLVTRRVGQFSKRNNMITNWLYQLRSIWPLYYSSFEASNIIGTELPRWFYFIFERLYCFVSTVAARNDELYADSYAMEIYNDEIVREMISADTLYRHYLQHHYWPAVDKILAISREKKIIPHAKMRSAVRNRLSNEKIAELLSGLNETEPSWNEGLPSLKSRLANIGHQSPYMSVPDADTAAEFYLGKSVASVTDEIDRRWLAASVVAHGQE